VIPCALSLCLVESNTGYKLLPRYEWVREVVSVACFVPVRKTWLGKDVQSSCYLQIAFPVYMGLQVSPSLLK
jgi:hypothetical protein